MTLAVSGVVIDVPARALEVSHDFWALVVGRPADISARPTEREWRLVDHPGIYLRITAGSTGAAGTVSLGVTDLAAERDRLVAAGLAMPDIRSLPGVIARLDFADPDGNVVTLWQSLLEKHPVAAAG
jgi:hypothetical protein